MRRILAIGAHPDDLEIGCGGTLVKHVNNGDEVTMLIVTNGEVGPGDVGLRISEQQAAAAVMGVESLIFGGLADCEVSLHELELVHLIERALNESRADIVYTHDVSDSHQDHRAVAHASLGAARHVSSVLTYDAPSSVDFAPTVYSDISDGYLDKKIEALMCHASQVRASAMVSAERVRAQGIVRGHQARVGAAEAFVSKRLLLNW